MFPNISSASEFHRKEQEAEDYKTEYNNCWTVFFICEKEKEERIKEIKTINKEEILAKIDCRLGNYFR